MKNIYLLLATLLFISTSCSTDLDQAPPNIASSNSLTGFEGVLNAAYNYQSGSATPLAIMGDFRADNAIFDESPHDEFNDFDGGLTTMEGDFFKPFYATLYKSILSANTVIINSSDATHIGEAKFLRALSYFKLVKVFGNVVINLSDSPSTSDTSILERQSTSDVYDVITSDLTDAIATLDNSGISSGRASKIAAQGLLGKVYMQLGQFSTAIPHLSAVINGASAANISLKTNFADVFATDLNSEILFATQISTSISITEYSDDSFSVWYGGTNTKADEEPINIDLVNAFDTAGDVTRKNLTLDTPLQVGLKYSAVGANQDWIELRLADVILLHAEATNEDTNSNGANSSAILATLDAIRTRAGLASLSGTATTQATVRTAIANERRLELAFEGQRWFDLVRTGTVDSEMGISINSNYHLFPIPSSEIFSSNNVIKQNTGY
jgi:hypothetical protein